MGRGQARGRGNSLERVAIAGDGEATSRSSVSPAGRPLEIKRQTKSRRSERRNAGF